MSRNRNFGTDICQVFIAHTMNFNDNDLTGLISEQDLARLFTSWRWVIGKDYIDVGYDLSVVPDKEKFKGARFLVQSKGTASRKKGRIVAQVSKRRLREYAENPHPVFIVRVTPDGNFYWVHAQEWAKKNFQKLDGDGRSGVRFDVEQNFSSKENFVQYLEKVMAPVHEKPGAMRELAKNRSNFLSSIDPRYIVKSSVIDGKEVYAISARAGLDDEAGKFTLKPKSDKDNVERFRGAIDFGLPTTIDVEEFMFDQSPLFEAMGFSGSLRGVLSINKKNTTIAVVYLSSGKAHSLCAAEVRIEVEIYSGLKGFVINNEKHSSVLKFNMKSSANRDHQASGEITFTLDRKMISDQQVQHFDGLGDLQKWAEEVIEKGDFRIEIKYSSRRIPLSFSSSMGDFLSFLRGCVVLGRLHKVAKYFKSNFVLAEDYELTEDEEGDIFLAYRLLKGERCQVIINSVEFESQKIEEADGVYELVVNSYLEINIGGSVLGKIPVEIFLSGFELEKLDGKEKYRCIVSEAQAATISFLESNLSEGVIKRA